MTRGTNLSAPCLKSVPNVIFDHVRFDAVEQMFLNKHLILYLQPVSSHDLGQVAEVLLDRVFGPRALHLHSQSSDFGYGGVD